MTKPKTAEALNRKSPIPPMQMIKLRASLRDLIAIRPRTCVELSKEFKMHDKTMMNHLRALRDLGVIHATISAKTYRASYIWHLGPGELIERRKYREKHHTWCIGQAKDRHYLASPDDPKATHLVSGDGLMRRK